MTETRLLGPLFASQSMRALFCDRALLQAMLDVEAALAGSQADLGILPDETARAISQACVANLYDIEEIGAATALAGNPVIPLVKALTDRVEGDAKAFVHRGATSQDVLDTALMLLAREGLALLTADVARAMRACLTLIERHGDDLMSGRTLLQQALPIPFGFKAALWLSGLTRAQAALRRVRHEAPALQFGGAVGTLAALGERGPAVRRALAARLRLAEPAITWHAERSRMAEITAALALTSGALAKIAGDVVLLMQSEAAEAFEPAAPGRGGSSTMPHKRNPVGSVAARANHRRIAGLTPTMLLAMEQEHERAAGAWHAEWETFAELFRLTGGSAERVRDILEGLEVDAARMRANWEAGRGLPMAESLMMALSPHVGRPEAQHRVEAAARRAAREGPTLAESAKADEAIAAHLDAAAIDAALDPSGYLGSARGMCDAAAAAARAELERANGDD